MPKISVIVPHLPLDQNKLDLMEKLKQSIDGQYDELIIRTEKSDNLAKVINAGLKEATGDYLMVSNDDLTLFKGKLADLCIPDSVTVPKVIGGFDKLFHGHFWCMSKEIYKKIGPIYEGYDGFYYDDSDYWMTIESKGIPIIKMEEVIVLHPNPATTLSQLHKAGREDTNRNIFVERWGSDALRRIQ